MLPRIASRVTGSGLMSTCTCIRVHAVHMCTYNDNAYAVSMQCTCSAHAVVCTQRSGLMRTLTQIAKAARGSPNRSTCVSRPRSARCRRTLVAHLCYKEGAGGTIMHLSVLTSTNPPTHQPTNPPLAPTHHGIHHGGSYAMHHGMHMACSMQCSVHPSASQLLRARERRRREMSRPTTRACMCRTYAVHLQRTVCE